MKPPRQEGPAVRHAGIIAAGLGSRLAGSHPGLAKPMVSVAGRPLCHWIVESLLRAGVTDITLLHNSSGGAMRGSLARAFPEVPFTFLQADTASSWESFRLVSRSLAGTAESFLLSTADALVPPADAAKFARAAASCSAVAGLALTAFVDDEKPLWADLSDAGFVTGLGDAAKRKQFVTCGLYFMTAAAAKAMPEAEKFPSLRRYLASLVDAGQAVAGYPLSKTLDVDRPEDIAQAEGFLKEAISTW
jgi:NDP-sugar pyrophosphorylase family protein